MIRYITSFNSKITQCFLCLMTLMLVVSCTFAPGNRFWLKKVEISAEDGINKNRIIVCNVVACYTDDANNVFKDLKAVEYFTTLKKKKAKYKDDIEIVLNVNIKPGTTKSSKVKLKSYSRVKGIYIFARYTSGIEGEFEASVGKDTSVSISLRESDILVQSAKEKLKSKASIAANSSNKN